MYDAKAHWESIYQTKKPDEVSWYQTKPKTSLDLIAEVNLGEDAHIIDVGAGDSKIVDSLLALGFRNITALDISSIALQRAKKRLGSKADAVKWVVSDLRAFETSDRYDLWHDRAVLHFLTEKEDINRFLESREVRKYFEGKVVAQLDLHESLTLAFANSEALHNRTPEEQSKVMRHLNSLSFKKVIGNIERRLMV